MNAEDELENMLDKLDELNKEVRFYRKMSTKKTSECPIYSSILNLWIESDEQLRNRIKKQLENYD